MDGGIQQWLSSQTRDVRKVETPRARFEGELTWRGGGRRREGGSGERGERRGRLRVAEKKTRVGEIGVCLIGGRS